MTVGMLMITAAALLLIPALLAPTSFPKPGQAPWPREMTPLLFVCWWINFFYCKLVHRIIIINHPDLPHDGAAILIGNHTSGIDHFILQSGCRRVLGFMIAKEFYEIPVGGAMCKWLGCIPVNRDGRDLSAVRAALRALESGRVVPIFPEGRILARSGEAFGDPRPGAAFLALKSRVPVYPAYIRGTPVAQGVWAAWFTPSRVRVIYGPPIDLSDLINDGPNPHESERALLDVISERLMDAIKNLRAASLAAEPE